MNIQPLNAQRGVTLISLILICILVVLVALVGIKVAPDVIEYFAIVKDVKATAQDPATKDASVAQIRRGFENRATVDNITAIASSDLDITKEGNDIVIAFAYTKKIHLFGPVSLSIDFEGSTAQ